MQYIQFQNIKKILIYKGKNETKTLWQALEFLVSFLLRGL